MSLLRWLAVVSMLLLGGCAVQRTVVDDGNEVNRLIEEESPRF